MKMKQEHKIALSNQAIEILQNQHKISNNSEYVFCSMYNKNRHIQRDTISKALRTLNRGKWNGKVTPHGFRATFRTISTLNLAYLMQTYGITNETIEEVMSIKQKA